jgi:hypothetical protein
MAGSAQRLITIALALLLAGCVVLTPDGRIDVAKSRRQAENACGYAFLRALPVAGTVVGAWFCTFGIDSSFPEADEAPAKPATKRKPKKPAPEPEPDSEVD